MSRNKLPTQEDLERLYDERGYGAVITYAYRNALRALSFLVMEEDLIEIFQEKTINNCYGIFWGLLLIQWVRQQSNDFTTKNTDNILSNLIEVFQSASDFAGTVAVNARRGVCLNLNPTSASACSTQYATFSVYSIFFPFDFKQVYTKPINPRSFTTYSATCTASRLYISIDSMYYDSIYYNYACKDFDYLQQGKLLPPLWHNNKPQEVIKLENKLIRQLIELGLDFLANDIKCLWDDKPLGEHAINYTKIYSNTIANNVKKLRRAIIEGIDTERLTATRVLLLGTGGAGKTTLADRLNNKPINEVIAYKSATIGINYHNHKAIDLKPFGIEQEIREDLQLYLWDFGGQSIFYGLHNAFLHENCVYVIVVDSRHEQAPDEWLYQIRNIVGDKNPPVLIVTNIYENCNLKQNKTRLLREFDDLLTENSFYYFPCDNPKKEHQEEFNLFVNQLVEIARDNQYEVFSDIITIKKEIQTKLTHQIFIKQRQLISYIKQLDLKLFSADSDEEELMEDLRSLGFIVRLKEQGNQFCLKPEWTVDHTYLLLHQLREKATNGLADENMIDEIIDTDGDDYTEKLLNFLQDRKLCHLVSTDKKKQYFFPDASSTNEPKKAEKILQEENKIQCCFNLPYMPLGLHARLVSDFSLADKKGICIQYHDGNTQDVWREGFIVSNQDNSIQAMVSYYYRKSYVDFTYTGEFKHATIVFQKLYDKLLASFNGKKSLAVSLILSDKDEENHYNMTLEEFIDFMQEVKGYKEFRDSLLKLEGKSMKESASISIGDVSNSPIQIHSPNSVQVANYVLTDAETKQLKDVINELLAEKDKFKESEQKTLEVIKQIVDKDEKERSEDEQGVITRFWKKLQELTSFSSNTIKISEWLVDKGNYATLATFLTSFTGYMSILDLTQ
ncbi:MAG: hypothetical protein CR966_00525 [Pseudomonadales bacterium]|nr:MAG: hypothetical protein CR966_00525 [Pseudomonadales bacterium]